MKTCTQEGVTVSQPGWGVSVESGQGKHILHVYRYYADRPNEWGGKGVFRNGDAYGMEFESSEAAWAYALDHGYIRVWLRSQASRNAHLAKADMYRQWAMDRLEFSSKRRRVN